MRQICASSPRSAAKFWLLMHDLILRHLFGISSATSGKFRLQSPLGLRAKLQEDDCASGTSFGLAAFCAAMLGPLEAALFTHILNFMGSLMVLRMFSAKSLKIQLLFSKHHASNLSKVPQAGSMIQPLNLATNWGKTCHLNPSHYKRCFLLKNFFRL